MVFFSSFYGTLSKGFFSSDMEDVILYYVKVTDVEMVKNISFLIYLTAK